MILYGLECLVLNEVEYEYEFTARPTSLIAHAFVKPRLSHGKFGMNTKTLSTVCHFFLCTTTKARFGTKNIIYTGLSAVRCPKTPEYITKARQRGYFEDSEVHCE